MEVEVPPWLKGLPLAPEYHPTEAEFTDPVAYISKIESEACQYGICKIVPPYSKASKRTVLMNLNSSLTSSQGMDMTTLFDGFAGKARNMGGAICIGKLDKVKPLMAEGKLNDVDIEAKFSTRRQQIGSNARRPRGGSQFPAQKLVWQSGESYTLEQFEAKAKAFSRARLGTCKEIAPLTLEALFWKAASEKPVSVEYANDIPGSAFAEPCKVTFTPLMQGKKRKRFLHKQETQAELSDATVLSFSDAKNAVNPLVFQTENGQVGGFTGKKEGLTSDSMSSSCTFMQHTGDAKESVVEKEGSGWKLANSSWNMRKVARSPGSLLRFMPDEVPGVTSPMVYIAMLFSWFAWHVEDHELHSLNYLHSGSPKTWYAVPPDAAVALEEVIRAYGYGGQINSRAALALLGEKTTILSPEVLVSTGVPCCRLVQNAGEFVVTFPRSYHLGFSHGFNCGEAANFATPGWLEVAKEAAVRRVALNHLPMFSHQQLLYYHAISFPIRSLNFGSKLRSSRLELKKRSLGEEIVKTKFVHDVIYNNNLLKDLLNYRVSSCLVFADTMKTSENNSNKYRDVPRDCQRSAGSFRTSGLRSLEDLHVSHLVTEQFNSACKSIKDDWKGQDKKTRLETTVATCCSSEAEEDLLLDFSQTPENEPNCKFHSRGLSHRKADSQSVKGNLHATLRQSSIDWESISCAACGSLCFLTMAVIQPTVTAAHTFRHSQPRDISKYQFSYTICGISTENELGELEYANGLVHGPITNQTAVSFGLKQVHEGCVSAAGTLPERITCTGIDGEVWYDVPSASIMKNVLSDDNNVKNISCITSNCSKVSDPIDPDTMNIGMVPSIKHSLEVDAMDDEVELTKRKFEEIQGRAFHDKELVTQNFQDAAEVKELGLNVEGEQSFDTTLTSLQLLAAAYSNGSESDDDEPCTDEHNLPYLLPDSTLGDDSDIGQSADAPWESHLGPLSEKGSVTVTETGKMDPVVSLSEGSHSVEPLDKSFVCKRWLMPGVDDLSPQTPAMNNNVPSGNSDEATIAGGYEIRPIETVLFESLTKSSLHAEKSIGVKAISAAECNSTETLDQQNIQDLVSSFKGCCDMEPLPKEKDGFGAVNSIYNSWQGLNSRPRIMCLEHAYKAQLQLQSRGGGHVLLIFHPSFREFEKRAQYLAMELGINHEWMEAPISSPNEDHLKMVNDAIDAAQDNALADHDWVAQLGMNVRHTYKMRGRVSSEGIECPEEQGSYVSANHCKPTLLSGNLKTEAAHEFSPQNLLRTRLHSRYQRPKCPSQNRPGGKQLKEKKCWVVGRWCGRDWRLDQVHVLLGGCRENFEPSRNISFVETPLGCAIGTLETLNTSTDLSQTIWSRSPGGTQTDSSSSDEQHHVVLKTSSRKRKDRGQKILSYIRKKRQHVSIQSSRCKRKINMSGSYKQKNKCNLLRKLGRKRKLVTMDLFSEKESSLTLSKTGSWPQIEKVIDAEDHVNAPDVYQCSSSCGDEHSIEVPSFSMEGNVLHFRSSVKADDQALAAVLPKFHAPNFTSNIEKNPEKNECEKRWKLHPAELHTHKDQVDQSTIISIESLEPKVKCGSASRTVAVSSYCASPLSPLMKDYYVSASSLPGVKEFSRPVPAVAEVIIDNTATDTQLCSASSCVSLSNSKKSRCCTFDRQTSLITSKPTEEVIPNLDGPSKSVWCDVPIACAASLDSQVARKCINFIEKSSCSCLVSQGTSKEQASPMSAACTKLCLDASQVSCNVTEYSSTVLEVGKSLNSLEVGLSQQVGSTSEKFSTGSFKGLDDNCWIRAEVQQKEVDADVTEPDACTRDYISLQQVSNSTYQMVPCRMGALNSSRICNQSGGRAFHEHSHCLDCDRKKVQQNNPFMVVSDTSAKNIQAKAFETQIMKHNGVAKEVHIVCSCHNSRPLFLIANSKCCPCQGDTAVSRMVSECELGGEAVNVAKASSRVAEVHEEQTGDYCCSISQCSIGKEHSVKPFSKLRSKRAKHSGWKKNLENRLEEDIISQEASELLCSGEIFNDNFVMSSGEQDLDLAKLKQMQILNCDRGDFSGGPLTRLRSKGSTTPADAQEETLTGDTLKHVQVKTVKKPFRKIRKGMNVASNDEASKPFQCNIDGCKMGFSTNKELVLHMNNLCTFKGCGKRLCTHNYLLQHFRVHIDDRPLKCPWKGCKKTFKWAWARTEHIRVHTGERPYVCQICNKRYRFVSDFSRHKRTTGHTPNA